jgi:peptide/nickel transport system permease protein
MSAAVETLPAEPIGVWRLRWRRLRRDRVAVGAGLLLLTLFVLCGAAPLIEGWLGVSGVETDLLARFDLPSAEHWLGCDDAGRDELARLLRGGWTSLTIGLLAALGSKLIGLVVGSIAGYMRGRTDMVLMRITDFMLSLPGLPLLIILAAIDLEKLGVGREFIRSGAAGYWRVVIILTLLNWTGIARLVRAGTMTIAEREFVLSARAQGATASWIMAVHILPNAIAPVIVATTLSMGRFILVESGLSFLGVGIQPPATSWGSMLTNAQELITTAPMLALWPGFFIFVSVIAINFLGDGLQAALDPRSDPR